MEEEDHAVLHGPRTRDPGNPPMGRASPGASPTHRSVVAIYTPQVSWLHRTSLGGAIWGFISLVVLWEADTIPKGAPGLDGFEAWRELIRFIDHGRAIRLHNVTNELRSAYMRPMKDMTNVEVVIAE